MTTTNNGANEMTDAKTLRAAAKAAGLNVRVRKGKGCRTGALHFFMKIDSTREERTAAHAFLIAHSARCSSGYGRRDLTAETPYFFDSATVHGFTA